MSINLLDTIEQGGCSAKLSAKELHRALQGLDYPKSDALLIDIETHDDGGVYKISDSCALIQTTDFFPPVCSDPFEFGQIAAANALSDVYAMGGKVLTAMNLLLFPASLPMDVLREILAGGHDKVKESEGVIIGGHTMADDVTKYGLAVTGEVHPNRIVTNSMAQDGDLLILTKPIGTGVVISSMKNSIGTQESYRETIASMKQLNKDACDIMQEFRINCATDITGFGLLGHSLKMAKASGKTFEFWSEKVPVFTNVNHLLDIGCIPSASFRNLDYAITETHFEDHISYEGQMLFVDAQSSGGLLMCVKEKDEVEVLRRLKSVGYERCSTIGQVTKKTTDNYVFVK